MSIATIQTKIEEAVTAQEAGDYATALTKLRSARMLRMALPSSVQHGDERIEYAVADIDLMIRDLESASAASTGIQSIDIEYQRPGAVDC